jgi:hypothetical protein
MLQQDLRKKAHYLAYRWFRNKNLEAAHSQAKHFADEHWRQFLGEAREQLSGHESAVLMDCDIRVLD